MGLLARLLVETLKTIQTEVPLVIMTYFNPLFQYGVENFVKDLADTAVKGLIIPDLPHEHANFVEPFFGRYRHCFDSTCQLDDRN